MVVIAITRGHSVLKRIIFVFFLFIVPLAAASGNPPQNSAMSAVPSLSAREALAIADRYVADHEVNLTEQHIGSIVLLFDETSKKRYYWHIQWRWSVPRIGGEYGLRIYMDGSVEEARLGP